MVVEIYRELHCRFSRLIIVCCHSFYIVRHLNCLIYLVLENIYFFWLKSCQLSGAIFRKEIYVSV